MTTTEQMPERDMDTTHVDAQQKRGARVHSRAQVPRASKEATIAALRSGRLTHIPVLVSMDVMRLDRWEGADGVPELTAETRLSKARYPHLAAALRSATHDRRTDVLHVVDDWGYRDVVLHTDGEEAVVTSKRKVKGREVLRSLQDPGHSTLCEIVELTSRHSCHHVSAQCACLSANAHFTKSKHYYAAFSATCGEITRHRCQTTHG